MIIKYLYIYTLCFSTKILQPMPSVEWNFWICIWLLYFLSLWVSCDRAASLVCVCIPPLWGGHPVASFTQTLKHLYLYLLWYFVKSVVSSLFEVDIMQQVGLKHSNTCICCYILSRVLYNPFVRWISRGLKLSNTRSTQTDL